MAGPATGFEMGAYASLKDFGAGALLMMQSRTFGDAMETCQVMGKWFYRKSWGRRIREDNTVRFEWPGSCVFDRTIEQLHLTLLVTLVRGLVSDDPLLQVYVTNEEAGERQVYENAWGCPVEFSSATAALEFPAAALALPVDTTLTGFDTLGPTTTMHGARR